MADKEHDQTHRGAERTDADRLADKERKRNQRSRDSEILDQIRVAGMEPWEARLIEATDKIAAEDNSKYGPGVPIPETDPEVIQARNDKFDRDKEDCERRNTQQGKRTLFALTHGMPVGWASLYPDQFPPELR